MWVKSRRCESSWCVEAAESPTEVLLRNSQKPEDVAAFTREQWADFVAGVRDGDFDFDFVHP